MNKNPKHGFKKGDPLASLAGKKSKRPPYKDIQEARKHNAFEFEQSLYKYMGCTLKQLQSAFEDSKTSARDLAVIAILMNAIRKGDNIRLNFLLDRTIGKVKDVTEVEVKSIHKTLVDLIHCHENDS